MGDHFTKLHGSVGDLPLRAVSLDDGDGEEQTTMRQRR
jgi:hypothetical protein